MNRTCIDETLAESRGLRAFAPNLRLRAPSCLWKSARLR